MFEVSSKIEKLEATIDYATEINYTLANCWNINWNCCFGFSIETLLEFDFKSIINYNEAEFADLTFIASYDITKIHFFIDLMMMDAIITKALSLAIRFRIINSGIHFIHLVCFVKFD